MKRQLVVFLAILAIITGCTKKEPTRTSGTDTIDNITYYSTTYYTFGFLFSGAKLVKTYPAPGPDITLYVNIDNTTPRLTLQSNNLNPSFSKLGDYPDAASAQSAFENLKTVPDVQWVDMADPILNNQVWIYKTGSGNYAKIRIISTVNETRSSIPYGECTFQWFYQADGSTTFTGK
jgi:hypothetical protein